MRFLIWIILLFTISVSAQTNLNFNKRFIDAEDKWVVLPINKDSTSTYGFVYLDQTAGLTFHLEGTYKLLNDGTIEVKKQPITQVIKQSLKVNNLKVALIPEMMYKELGVEKFPDWLKFYKQSSTDIGRLFMLGLTHNAWNESEKGLTYLLKVQQINPKYNGLSYELSFAYNALKQFEKAIEVLNEAIQNNPKNCELYKELIYAQMNLKQVDKGMEAAKVALNVCTEKNFRYQIFRDLLYYYFNRKDKEQFKILADKAKIEMTTVPGALQAIANWETELYK